MRDGMLNDQNFDMSSSQKKRLAHIDFRVNFLGSIGRSDLIDRYGIKEAAATRDIAEYRRLVPDNLCFDGLSRRYNRSTNFAPLFKVTASQALTALCQGLGEDFFGEQKPFIPCESPAHLQTPSIEILSSIARSIHQRKILRIGYRSTTSGSSSREIIPFVIVNNGLRWHVRAYDRKRELFTDFVLTRITEAEIADGYILDHEAKDADIQWNRIVQLQLAAHPSLKFPETIEFDYGMKNGYLNVNVRAAIAGYLLRLWNVDCSQDHHLISNEIQLCLKNPVALYGVESNFLAPGYTENS